MIAILLIKILRCFLECRSDLTPNPSPEKKTTFQESGEFPVSLISLFPYFLISLLPIYLFPLFPSFPLFF